MKRLIAVVVIGSIFSIFGCKDDGSKNEINPLIFLGQCAGDSSLTVRATYTGSETGTGTKRMFVYLYNQLGATTRDPKPSYTGSTAAAAVSGVEQEITITDICSGDYYVLVFYDANFGDINFDNQQDPYILYTNTPYREAASKVNIDGDVTLSGIAFTDTHKLLEKSAFLSTTTYSVTVSATYTGAASADPDATKRIYVYLYQTSLGTSTTVPSLPVNSASTTGPVTPGTQYAVTVNGVLGGNYYALVFYDAEKGGDTTGSEGDPYAFFTGTPYTANAQQFTVGTSNVTLPAFAFGDTNTLQAGAAYMSGATTYTFTVNASYTGTRPDDTKTIYVYLYGVLGTGTRNQYRRIYQGQSAAVSSTDPYAISVNNVIPGDYYILVAYNYDSSGGNLDNATDRYRLYDSAVPAGTACPAQADSFTISGADSISDIVIDDAFALLSQSMFDTSGCP